MPRGKELASHRVLESSPIPSCTGIHDSLQIRLLCEVQHLGYFLGSLLSLIANQLMNTVFEIDNLENIPQQPGQ